MAWTQAKLDALNDAIASGVRSVSYDGETVTYRTLDEMLRIRDEARVALGLNTRRLRRVRVNSQKGF